MAFMLKVLHASWKQGGKVRGSMTRRQGPFQRRLAIRRRAFESLAFLHGLGERIARKRIANEKDLEYFQHISVEDPVRSIVEHLVSVAEVRAAFALGDGIVFENHPNAISDISEEVVDRLATPQRPRTPDQPRFERLRLRPDQICIYRQEGETSTQRTMLYINEYKAPHKITPQHLRVGLRSMDICLKIRARLLGFFSFFYRSFPVVSSPEDGVKFLLFNKTFQSESRAPPDSLDDALMGYVK
ncbi:hypothetical protein PG991_009391 [Apiospora marii]|uniref:Uncharacterized protein n=1 Tax=Apiospora marii TaxID=335849 RepID=A0ABR1RKT3_9PEZI